jgi:hypothetical protein
LVLLLVIALAWLAVVTMVVAVCRAAARADAADDRGRFAGNQFTEPIYDGLVAWDRAAATSLRAEWLPARSRGARAHVHAPGPPAAGVRGRRPAVTPPS